MSNDENIQLRPYETGDEEGLVKLLEHVFGGWPDRDISCPKIDFWRWKYLDSPIGKNCIALAEKDDEIIACSHGLYYYTNIGGTTCLTSQSTDVATLPEHRGKGLFSKLEAMQDRIHEENKRKFNIAVHTNPYLIERAKRLQTERDDRFFFDKIFEMVRIIDVNEHLSKTSDSDNVKKYLGYQALRSINKAKQLVKKESSTSSHGLSVDEIECFEDNVDVFGNELNRYLRFNVVKRRDYLNWRYCDKRAGNYIVKVATRTGDVYGFIVLKINKLKEYHTGNIVELVSHPEHPNVYNILLKDATEYFDDNEVNVTRLWALRDHNVERYASNYGFIDNKSGLPVLTFRRHDLTDIQWDSLKSSTVEKIHFQMGDTEWM